MMLRPAVETFLMLDQHDFVAQDFRPSRGLRNAGENRLDR